MWYTYDKVLTYNAMLNFIIGERGVGKSYGIKKHVLKKFKKKHKQFIYLRRYDTELRKSLKDNEFFKDIELSRLVTLEEYNNRSRRIRVKESLIRLISPVL